MTKEQLAAAPGRHGAADGPAGLAPPPVIDPDLLASGDAATWLVRGSTSLAIVAGVTIMALMLVTTGDVIFRKLGIQGFRGVVEWTQVLLVIAVFSGMAATELSGFHLRGASMVTSRSGSVTALLARAVGSFAGAALLSWGVVASGQAAVQSVRMGEYSMGVVAVAVWPAKVMVSVGLAGFVAALLYRGVTQARALVGLATRPQQPRIGEARGIRRD